MSEYNGLKYSAGILGMGKCVPDNVLTNKDLENMVDTSNEWIVQRTGILERRILDKDTPLYELGSKAAIEALKNAGLTPDKIDLIIATTETPDYLTPSMACLIQKSIGASNAAAFDLNAACTGAVYGLTVASQFIVTGYYKYVLVVSCEGLSRVVDWKDRKTCVLFGDGAAAMVVGQVEKGYGILATHIGADGSMGHNITIPCCYIDSEESQKRLSDNKMVIWMDGSEVFKFAVRVMVQATENVLNQSGISIKDLSLIIPHQANMRIIESAVKRLDIPPDRVFSNVQKYGNTSSASIPIALIECIEKKLVAKGSYIVLVGFGGGLTWASALIKWSKEE
ncbi:MAG TPA: ketoacyl-ACP synthase III [Clostridiaceae bacterium]|nr:ketoacyl-ACP synthase III [Clostridiaceae bacterium]